jgi:hypothetical protein
MDLWMDREIDGRMNGWIDKRWMDGLIRDGWMDGLIRDGWMNGWMDR